MKVLAGLGLLLAGLVLVLHALFTPRAVTTSLPTARATYVAAAGADSTSERRTLRDDDEGALDLYGNEVIDAIATYTFDPTGSLYELHSPQTELPHLASPKS